MTAVADGWEVAPGGRASFLTYFNAFPASYWSRWTPHTQVRLEVDLSSDDARVQVCASDAHGERRRVGEPLSPVGGTVVRELRLVGLGDGGWYWFDVTNTGGEPLRVHAARWRVPPAARPTPPVSLAITTFDRVEDCLRVLGQIGRDRRLAERLRRVVVVDQGTRSITDSPRFPDVARELGNLLRVVRQTNLGGSGGFARGLTESLNDGAERVVLLDDDVALPAGTLSRMIALSDHAEGPLLVGGQMLDMSHPTVLHAFTETVDRRTVMPALDEGGVRRHDFGEQTLAATSWMHRRGRAEYNGWWACLIPREAVDRVGLPLPFFIKWDDTEMALRAGGAGIPTVTLPGAGIWHVAWGEKDDLVGWQAYFYERNRLVTALLHYGRSTWRSALLYSLAVDVKHAVAMQYSALDLRVAAAEAVLAGPRDLAASLPTALSEVRARARAYDDARYDLPARPPGTAAPRVGSTVTSSAGALRALLRGRLRLPRASAGARTVYLTHAQATWRVLATMDEAIVENADGTAAARLRRDVRTRRELLGRSLRARGRLLRRHGALSRAYRSGLARLAGTDSWNDIFENAKD
ncbi:glycosyltransferase [Cellulosimicrobium protaetiae]|uniref:Glycosyltransferase n=1 Tax=Cellulosimicrobium protaetiae TaxID=2587808 RepID=A0A6M5UD04_9MICO|nr:glycosyltransferase [Cellulosimicrobium protaetiae]QJW36100.1 glycosyltransferase [Cellulosimicrobium protaetiae]